MFEFLLECNAEAEGKSHPLTGGSVGCATVCPAGGREFKSGRTNTQGLKITEES